jgi:hypothetical protein
MVTGDLRTLITSGSFNADGAITQAGNQVLHAGNYTSYALQSGVTRRRGSSYGHAAYGLGRDTGRNNQNCGDFDYGNCNTYLYQGNALDFDMYYERRVCYNCNCNCDCCC